MYRDEAQFVWGQKVKLALIVCGVLALFFKWLRS